MTTHTTGFVVPVKCVHSKEDMTAFRRSPTFSAIVGWIRSLNESVVGVRTDSACAASAAVSAAIAALDQLSAFADEIEPLPSDNRFGNKAFRTWHERLVERSAGLVSDILAAGGSPAGAAPEIASYLQDSFGNPVRIDYGTGHELHFVAFLYCLRAVGAFSSADSTALVIRVFSRYLALCRKLQARYHQEPAGSHGVWGLDDHQFIPFIWGAAQLIDHPTLTPGSILDPQAVERHHAESLYLDCIRHINSVKKGPFHEHSPDLYNISSAASWRKINSGMQKKYDVDVLQKWPVVQHFLFGSILPCTWTPSAPAPAPTTVPPPPPQQQRPPLPQPPPI